MEREYKFTFPTLEAAQAFCEDPAFLPHLSLPELFTMESAYFDTPEGLLRSQGGSLRLRRENGVGICCMKRSREKDKKGLAIREEYEVPAKDLKEGLSLLPGAGAPGELCRILEQEELTQIAAMRFLRAQQTYEKAGLSFHLCRDMGFFLGKRRALPFWEVELELTTGSLEEFDALVLPVAERHEAVAQLRSKLARSLEV